MKLPSFPLFPSLTALFHFNTHFIHFFLSRPQRSSLSHLLLFFPSTLHLALCLLLPKAKPGCPVPLVLITSFQFAWMTLRYLLQPGLLRKFLLCSVPAPRAKSQADRKRWRAGELAMCVCVCGAKKRREKKLNDTSWVDFKLLPRADLRSFM